MNLFGLALWALQRSSADAVAGLVFFAILLTFFLGLYAFVAFCFMRMADKLHVEDSWWAWVPILNALLALKMAGKPLWWFVLLLVPFVNLVIGIIVLVDILKALNKPPLLVIGFFIPLVNLFVLGYLAFSD